jgi:sulfur carrier protein
LIIINGEKTDIKGDMKLLSWLDFNGIDPKRIAVEYNGEILNRSDFNGIFLKDGDTLEIVIFMGGG